LFSNKCTIEVFKHTMLLTPSSVTPSPSSVTPSSCLFCPITYDMFVDPIKAPDGHTYERSALTQALAVNGLSPITRQAMTINECMPDYTMLSLIDEYNQSQETKVENVKEEIEVIEAKVNSMTGFSLVTLNTLDGENSGKELVFVVDISGSMQTEMNNGNESDGFSLLDIVKHGIITCLEGLRSVDSVSIIAYSSSARMTLPMTRMSLAGKKRAKTALNSLQTEGSTNIWGGLKLALDQLNDGGTILLLTDGCPNIRPPRGELAMLRQELDKNEDVVLNTYGFGYNLDSPLLMELSNETFGSYSFIPTVGEVGTIFVNAMANLRTSLNQKTKIAIETTGIISMPNLQKTSWGYFLNIGQLTKGQTRTVEIRCTETMSIDILDVQIEHTQGSFEPVQSQAVSAGILHCYELAKTNSTEATEALDNLISSRDWEPAILKDLNGQVREAITTKEYKRWGKHYLPSLSGAYFYQTCNNFLDQGIQQFGGETFQKVRLELDALFNLLEPPKATHRERIVQNCIRNGRAITAPLRNMSTYNDSYGGCFAGHCRVLLADGTYKRCDQIKKGDSVTTSFNGHCTVACVVETVIDTHIDLVKYGTLLSTKWHPIKLDGKWTFPIKIENTEKVKYKENVYSFLINDINNKIGQDMIIENQIVITHAHNILEDDVASHPFYGTGEIIKALKLAPEDAFNQGKVLVSGVQRDAVTKLVCGFYH